MSAEPELKPEPRKIDQKIVGYKVVDKVKQLEEQELATQKALQVMSEEVKRPEYLRGTTYKLKPPTSEHALYVTINDIVLNEGTEHEKWHPYEMFLNSKNMDSFQWITALTRVVSAVFRTSGDIGFLVEELKSTFDPRGGYFKGRVYMPSIVADIGYTLEKHLKRNGIIPDASDEQKEMIQKIMEEKEFEIRDRGGEIEFPEHAVLCARCSTKAVVKMDGCMTCLNCGDSKCQ